MRAVITTQGVISEIQSRSKFLVCQLSRKKDGRNALKHGFKTRDSAILEVTERDGPSFQSSKRNYISISKGTPMAMPLSTVLNRGWPSSVVSQHNSIFSER